MEPSRRTANAALLHTIVDLTDGALPSYTDFNPERLADTFPNQRRGPSALVTISTSTTDGIFGTSGVEMLGSR